MSLPEPERFSVKWGQGNTGAYEKSFREGNGLVIGSATEHHGNRDRSGKWSWGSNVGVLLVLLVTLGPVTGCARAPDSETDTPGMNWSLPRRVASGDGFRGSWRMNRSLFHYVDDPNVFLRDDGIIDVTWVNQARKDVYFQRFGPDGDTRFERPTNVSGTPDVFSWFPDVISDPANPDNIYVLWQEIVFSGGSHGGEIYFARSTDGGRTFSGPINLSTSKAGDGKGRLTDDRWDNGSLDLEVAPDGTLYAVWTEYQGRLWLSRSTDSGRSFSVPRLIAGEAGELPARGPSLAVAEDGTLRLVWTVGKDPSADVRFQVLNARGRSFSSPRRIHSSDNHADAPKVAIDENGRVHLVFSESPMGPLENYHIRYARKDAGESEFGPFRVLGDTTPGRFSSRNYPSLALDGAGNPYVMWESFRTNPRHPAALEFTHSSNRGRDFREPGVIPNTRAPEGGFIGSLQGHIMGRLSVNEDGRVALGHSDFVRNQESNIWLLTGTPEK